MEEANESDLLRTQLDLVDLSGNEFSSCPIAVKNEEDSPHQSTAGPRGFCVKEYEEEMQSLKKDNFNLKLRIYFLEEKNPNIPMGAEALYKQNIDLKVMKRSSKRMSLVTNVVISFSG
jgi:Centrosomin N-terminal motif 1